MDLGAHIRQETHGNNTFPDKLIAAGYHQVHGKPELRPSISIGTEPKKYWACEVAKWNGWVDDYNDGIDTKKNMASIQRYNYARRMMEEGEGYDAELPCQRCVGKGMVLVARRYSAAACLLCLRLGYECVFGG